jgi:hypothetical protein
MLKHFDGFDAYDSTGMGLRYNDLSAVSVGASGRNGGNCLLFSGTGSFVHRNYGGSSATAVQGAALYWGSFFPDNAWMVFGEVSGALWHLELKTDTAGHLYVRHSGTGAVLATSSKVLALSTFYYVEFKVTVHDTTGAFEVRVNSETWVSGSGIDTRNGGAGIIDRARLGGFVNLSYNWRADDWYVCDGTTGLHNTFLGDVRCEVISPSGAGAHTDWSPSAGANYTTVDEKPANSDTDYNSSSTAAQIDTFAFGDLAEATADIFAVQHYLFSRKDDAGSRTIRPKIRISGTDYSGANIAVTDTYKYDTEIVEQSPATSTDWTVSEVNGAEFGYELVS